MIIADTGFFFALANQDDDYHSIAKRTRPLLNESLITTYPVMTETCYLLLENLGNKAQCQFLRGYLAGAFEVFDLQIVILNAQSLSWNGMLTCRWILPMLPWWCWQNT
jgi:uncharacterized protein